MIAVAAGLLAIVCAVAYWNSFRAQLILDNIPIILHDTRLRTISWRSLHDIFAFNYWWPSGDSDLYRPLTTLSYWLNYSVLGGGSSPGGYHAINLALHWLNAVLAYVLVRGVTGRAFVGLAAAAVLGCHPITVESVTNVIGRADLMASLSVVGGLLLYRGYLGADASRRPRWLAALCLAYLAGVFSKESAVVLPAVMLLHDALFPPAARGGSVIASIRRSAARVWPAYAVLAPGLAALVWARMALFAAAPPLTQFGGDNPIVNAPFWTGAMTAVKVAGYYLALVAWPAALSCDYSHNAITLFGWTITSGQDAHAWLGLGGIVALIAAAAAGARRWPATTFFLGFAGIAWLPTSNLLFPIGTIMAERLMYLPLVGLAAAAALGLEAAGSSVRLPRTESGRRGWAIARMALAAAVIAALSARTIIRNEDWTSTARLWSSASRVVPGSYRVHKALALEAFESDPAGSRVDEAIALAERSIGIIETAQLPLHQQPAGLYAEAGSYRLRKAQLLSGGGSAAAARVELTSAVALLERAERIDREAARLARERATRAGRRPEEVHDTGSPFIYRTLATAYLGIGDPLRALASAEYLQRLSPQHFDPHYLRGVTEAAAAQFEEGRGNNSGAEAHLERAAVNLVAATLLNPAHRESWSLLSKVYGYIAPEPPAVVSAADGGRLNRDSPAVRRHVATALSQLLAQLRAAGRTDDAAALEQQMARAGWTS